MDFQKLFWVFYLMICTQTSCVQSTTNPTSWSPTYNGGTGINNPVDYLTSFISVEYSPDLKVTWFSGVDFKIHDGADNESYIRFRVLQDSSVLQIKSLSQLKIYVEGLSSSPWNQESFMGADGFTQSVDQELDIISTGYILTVSDEVVEMTSRVSKNLDSLTNPFTKILKSLRAPIRIAAIDVDLNRDLIADTIFINYMTPSTILWGGSGRVDTLVFDPSQTNGILLNWFHEPRDVQSNTSVVVGDFNQDDYPDFVIGRTHGQKSLIFINNGNKKFYVSPLPGDTTDAQALVLEDLNHDGKKDLIVGNGAINSKCFLRRFDVCRNSGMTPSSIYLGLPNGAFGSPLLLPGTGLDVTAIAVGDLNQDGHSDLVLGTKFQRDHIFEGLGDGHFIKRGTLSDIPQNTTALAITKIGDSTGNVNTDTPDVIASYGFYTSDAQTIDSRMRSETRAYYGQGNFTYSHSGIIEENPHHSLSMIVKPYTRTSSLTSGVDPGTIEIIETSQFSGAQNVDGLDLTKTDLLPPGEMQSYVVNSIDSMEVEYASVHFYSAWNFQPFSIQEKSEDYYALWSYGQVQTPFYLSLMRNTSSSLGHYDLQILEDGTLYYFHEDKVVYTPGKLVHEKFISLFTEPQKYCGVTDLGNTFCVPQ